MTGGDKMKLTRHHIRKLMQWPLLAFILLASGQNAWSLEQRTALVIGNQNYTHIKKLNNAGNDARDVAAKLRSLGFEVDLLLDADRATILRNLARFGEKIAAHKEVSLFYYAGHAVQIDGENYLIPVSKDEENIKNKSDVEIYGVRINAAVLKKMDEAKSRIKLVFLDACRDNPFVNFRSFGSGGLAKTSHLTEGFVVVFSTAAGKVASDGDPNDRNSIFTRALLNNFDYSEEISMWMRKVSSDVLSYSHDMQRPEILSNLNDVPFYLVPKQTESTRSVHDQKRVDPSSTTANNADRAMRWGDGWGKVQ